MKIRCTYCNTKIDDTVEKCPHCGAANDQYQRESNETPHTIEELKKWYENHNLPPEDVTRFFIGKDYKKPKAFGIYKDSFTGNYVVYKNKADGSRATRYEGDDEAYAVNELYLKLKEEIQNQKHSHSDCRKERTTQNVFENKFNNIMLIVRFLLIFISIPIIKSFGSAGMTCLLTMFLTLNPGIFLVLLISNLFKSQKHLDIFVSAWHILSIILAIVMFFAPAIVYYNNHANDGYYIDSNEVEYYYYGSTWYSYDDTTDTWNSVDEPSDVTYEGSKYKSSLDSDFESSSYYDPYSYSDDDWYSSSGSSSDWDSDSDWNSSDSWDSGGTDWDSDW